MFKRCYVSNVVNTLQKEILELYPDLEKNYKEYKLFIAGENTNETINFPLDVHEFCSKEYGHLTVTGKNVYMEKPYC